jgi:hypothetical protein
MATATEVAEWMLEELRTEEILPQTTAAYEIADRFGEEFIYYNANGNPAIDKEVLAEFRRLSGSKVVWSRSNRHWRLREESDEKGRRQY